MADDFQHHVLDRVGVTVEFADPVEVFQRQHQCKLPLRSRKLVGHCPLAAQVMEKPEQHKSHAEWVFRTLFLVFLPVLSDRVVIEEKQVLKICQSLGKGDCHGFDLVNGSVRRVKLARQIIEGYLAVRPGKRRSLLGGSHRARSPYR
jgi:hypothetical protein